MAMDDGSGPECFLGDNEHSKVLMMHGSLGIPYKLVRRVEGDPYAGSNEGGTNSVSSANIKTTLEVGLGDGRNTFHTSQEFAGVTDANRLTLKSYGYYDGKVDVVAHVGSSAYEWYDEAYRGLYAARSDQRDETKKAMRSTFRNGMVAGMGMGGMVAGVTLVFAEKNSHLWSWVYVIGGAVLAVIGSGGSISAAERFMDKQPSREARVSAVERRLAAAEVLVHASESTITIDNPQSTAEA